VAPCAECEEVEPEPKEEVDLLVDDVEREDAEAVELLLASGCANAVEGAAGKGLSHIKISHITQLNTSTKTCYNAFADWGTMQK
jgi:hypothetical protein